jgi:hypothetical protein
LEGGSIAGKKEKTTALIKLTKIVTSINCTPNVDLFLILQ